MMTTINVDAVVTAPTKLTIPLIRADHHETCNIFRTFFEIFLALFSGLLGHTLSLKVPEKIHYVSLAICGVSALIFMIISIRISIKAKSS